MEMKNLRFLATTFSAALLAFAIAIPQAWAGPVTVNGLTFSEVSAGFTITGGSGTGTEQDPIVLNETVTGLDVTLSIEGMPQFGNLTGSGHSTGFAIQKVVTNNTGIDWDFYDHELQEILGTPSSDGDGLSFAQGYAAGRPWTSDVFMSYNEIILPRDYINFFNGIVPNGGEVTFNYIITDNSPIDLFYLRQRPDFEAVIPEPGTLLLFGTGLTGLALVAFRRKRK
ncbi:MAG: PEP-CTERM sorting domain-containing protein [Acidobacteria bacterium]|nr:PEP-CTERM sorting domain-containing protein [Acidobacteriota bacterium]